jgi:hypothetical protein
VAAGRLPDDPAPSASRRHQNPHLQSHLRATGITTYLRNAGKLEHAQTMANHSSPRTTKLYNRREEEISLDEVERIAI